jgi:aryl-phospho-beta-D-glucosidase BglC (GH1 family)
VLRICRIALLTALLAVLVPTAASAAGRMPIGFQDDPTFRWLEGAPAQLDRVQEAGASIIRATADWRAIAPKRPARATNPFDPAYNLNDLDDMIRNAQQRGIQVMLTIWGTPGWANGGKEPNVPPRKVADLQNFARALADRYSGRHAGYPYVGHYSIWNEPNLQIFLSPQFNAKGKIVSPITYAKLYKAGYKGIKTGNKKALVAIGETSNQGRDHPAKGKIGDSVAPATFARMLGGIKGLRFDAYAEHPYATRPNLSPSQKVRFPNVTMTQLKHFEDMLDVWFKRKDVPVWITEYGYETKPGEPAGVTNSQQSKYMSQVIRQLKADPRVHMFIWFIFKDSKQSLWQSGLFNASGAAKSSYRTFSNLAPTVAGETIAVKAGRTPSVTVAVPRLAAVTPVGTSIGVTYKVFVGTKLITVDQAAPVLSSTASVTFPIGISPEPGTTYRLEMDLNDPSGNHALWTYDLVTPGGKTTAATKKKK